MTTVPVFLAADRTTFVVLGTAGEPVLTWDRDYEIALDFARIHNGLVVAVPVLADYTSVQAFPAGDDAGDVEHVTVAEESAEIFSLPHRTHTPVPAVPSAAGAEVYGFAVGGRAVDRPNGWDFRREQEDEAEAQAVLARARRAVGPTPAQIVADAYRALGVGISPAAADAISTAPASRPGVETLVRIRDGLQEHLSGPETPPLDDGPTVVISRKAALPPPGVVS